MYTDTYVPIHEVLKAIDRKLFLGLMWCFTDLYIAFLRLHHDKLSSLENLKSISYVR